MPLQRRKSALLVLVVGILLGGALIFRTRSVPISPSTLDRRPSENEIRYRKALAEHGNLAAAEGLRGHYCLFTDDTNACEYWSVRVAELGSGEERCDVISQFDEFNSYSQFADRIAALKAKSHCTTTRSE